MEIIIGLFVLLFGASLYYKKSGSSAKGLLENLETAVKDLSNKEAQYKETAKKEMLNEELKELDKNEDQAKKDANQSDVGDNIKFWNKPSK